MTKGDKLLSVLYNTTASETRRRSPLVTRFLRSEDPATASVLDDLMDHQWKQKPMAAAIADVGSTVSGTNVLRFPCPNSYLSNTDFFNLYPFNRDRVYSLPKALKDGVKFTVIKGRNPTNLVFAGNYYLVFPSFVDAAVYYMETRSAQVGGFSLSLKFVPVKENELKYMSSPFLDPQVSTEETKTLSKYAQAVGAAPIRQLFKASSSKSAVLENILQVNDFSNEPVFTPAGDPVPHESHYPLLRYIDFESRKSSVLVRNLPFGLSKYALPRLLWDYDLAHLDSIDNCFTTVQADPVSQVHLTIIRFADSDNARRFVSTFHGRRWHSVQSAKEKRLYEPILCEVIN